MVPPERLLLVLLLRFRLRGPAVVELVLRGCREGFEGEEELVRPRR